MESACQCSQPLSALSILPLMASIVCASLDFSPWCQVFATGVHPEQLGMADDAQAEGITEGPMTASQDGYTILSEVTVSE